MEARPIQARTFIARQDFFGRKEKVESANYSFATGASNPSNATDNNMFIVKRNNISHKPESDYIKIDH